jgi:single-strand DNA-binding protein
VTGRLDQRSWETESGDKRSKVEIIADEVGVSLRWATAQVTRTPREGGNGYGGGNGGGNAPRNAAPAPAPAQAPAGGGSYDPYDEPF